MTVVLCNVKECENNEDGYCEREKIHIDSFGGCCEICEEEKE